MKHGIKGQISAFPITDILQWIEASRKSGVLVVKAEALSFCLCFEDGRLLMASSQSEGKRLADILNSGMQVPAEFVRSTLEKARAESAPLIRLLIETSEISADALHEVLRHAAEDVVIEILRLPGGAFEFIEEVPSYMKGSPVKLPTGGIVFESVRRFDEMKRSAL